MHRTGNAGNNAKDTESSAATRLNSLREDVAKRHRTGQNRHDIARKLIDRSVDERSAMLDANVVAEILGSEIVAGIDDYVVVVDEFCRFGIEASGNGVDL